MGSQPACAASPVPCATPGLRAVARRTTLRRPHPLDGLVRAWRKTPAFEGARLTWRRRLNFHLVRFQRLQRHTRVWGLPYVLTVDPLNGCNLRCPHCVTGAGKRGHKVAAFPEAFYRRLLDELGSTLLLVEFGNWGEPLLHANLPVLIQEAVQRGIGTIVATHLSVPLDDRRADALITSGLGVIGVAADGARQESYAQYRRGGSLDLVEENMARLVRRKQALGSATPRIVWSFHVFAHNEHEIDDARARAAALGVDFAYSKGFVTGPDWDPDGRFHFTFEARPGQAVEPCSFLWERAVVAADGSVAPCLGAFHPADDCGDLQGRRFRDVWNGDRFRAARRLYRSAPTPGHETLCTGCPQTLLHADYQTHLAGGETTATFRPRFTPHDGWNYFFHRQPT
jgi:hypothetical protein